MSDFTTMSDLISIFFLSHKKENLIDSILSKLNEITPLCSKERDDYWNQFVSVINEATVDLKGPTRNAFFGKLFSNLRLYLKSANPLFSDNNVNSNTSSEEPRGGDEKKFRLNAQKVMLTYICKDFPYTKEEILDYFTKNSSKFDVKQAIACDEIAPETGEKHVHIYLIFNEKLDTKDARNYFKYKDLYPNIKKGTNVKGAILYCIKGGNYVTFELDVEYELNTRKAHKQLIGYQLINKKKSLVEVTSEAPETLYHYKQLKDNLNAYLKDLEDSKNPGNPLFEWEMFDIQTWFSGKGKTPQYWIVGPTDVGKTENIKALKSCGHKAYLMPKNNDWFEWNDDYYDFMYCEETHADFQLTFLNQLLEGTEQKLNGKGVNNIHKNKNVPVILNSNYMPHMVYKNTDLYSLSPLLTRIYIIYVDKINYKGHIIWNPNTMTLDDYAQKFVNNNLQMQDYDAAFVDEFENESSTQKSYIKYRKNIEVQNNSIPVQEITIDSFEPPRENRYYRFLGHEPRGYINNQEPQYIDDIGDPDEPEFDIETDAISVSTVEGFTDKESDSDSVKIEKKRLKNRLKRNKKKLKKLKIKQAAEVAVSGAFEHTEDPPGYDPNMNTSLDDMKPNPGYISDRDDAGPSNEVTDTIEEKANENNTEPVVMYYDDITEMYGHPIDYTINCNDDEKVNRLRQQEKDWKIHNKKLKALKEGKVIDASNRPSSSSWNFRFFKKKS